MLFCCRDTNRGADDDIVRGMPLEPSPTSNRKNLHRVTLQDVLAVVAEIDDILKHDFGGKGRGIHSKLDSLDPALPHHLDKKLRYFEAVRNKALTQPDWPIPNRASYMTECRAMARRLRHIAQQRDRRRRMLVPFQRLRARRGSIAVVVAALGVLLLVHGAISSSV